MLENQENVKCRLDKGYHVVSPPYIGNYIPPKPDLMFIDEHVKSESIDVVFNVSSSVVKTVESKVKSVIVKNKGVYNIVKTKHVKKNIFSPPIIKDWIFNDEKCRAPKNKKNRGREYGRKTMLVENPTEKALIAQDGFEGYDWSYQAKEEHPTNYAIMALTSSESSSSSDSEKAEKERDELKLTLKKYQNSSKSLNTVLESQVSDKVKTGLGYKAASPFVEDFVNSFEMLENQENVKCRLDKGYHVVPPPYIGNYIPPKPDLMFIDEHIKSESIDVVFNVSSSAVKTVESKVKSIVVKIRVCTTL
nr:hypothetical protein [Tanacetum cinerariifolium]